MKLRKVKRKIEKDWDFDFSIYETEDIKEQALESITKSKKPRITNLRSKYSPSLLEIESISQIKNKISQMAIKVAAQTQDLDILYNLYGCLNEYWARICDIFGTGIIIEVKELQKECLKKIREQESKSCVSYETHDKLLEYRDKIYMIAQRSNLGLEVEKIKHSRDKAKSGIIE